MEAIQKLLLMIPLVPGVRPLGIYFSFPTSNCQPLQTPHCLPIASCPEMYVWPLPPCPGGASRSGRAPSQ